MIGLDLGSSNIRVWTPDGGIIYNEPSVVSFDRVNGGVDKIGYEAKKLLGKTENGSTLTVCPLREGVIAGVEETIKLIYTVLRELGLQNPFSRPSVLVGVPNYATAVERSAVAEAIYRAGARAGGVFLVREPYAAALGANLSISRPRGNMVVDIGSGTTEAMIISMDGVVVAESSSVASGQFDEAIRRYMYDRFDIDIGITTAEEIKINMGSVCPTADGKSGSLTGLNVRTRRPSKISIHSNMISDAIREHSKAIVNLLKTAIKEAPPEICADILDNGITVTGGGALIGGMAQLLHNQLSVPIHIAKNPSECVINGIGKIIQEDLEQYIEQV